MTIQVIHLKIFASLTTKMQIFKDIWNFIIRILRTLWNCLSNSCTLLDRIIVEIYTVEKNKSIYVC
jgi:hypothetical protein